jgi:hypothetical protein
MDDERFIFTRLTNQHAHHLEARRGAVSKTTSTLALKTRFRFLRRKIPLQFFDQLIDQRKLLGLCNCFGLSACF